MSQFAREDVVRVARGYLRTPYHHGAKLKGVGLDCATLLEAVYNESRALPAFEVAPYAHQWHLHSDDPLYEKAIVAFGGREVPDITGIGDILLYFQGRQYAHGAIVTAVEPLRILHAFAPAKCVIEGLEAEFALLMRARRKIFTIW